jgi:hypothetical protein
MSYCHLKARWPHLPQCKLGLTNCPSPSVQICYCPWTEASTSSVLARTMRGTRLRQMEVHFTGQRKWVVVGLYSSCLLSYYNSKGGWYACGLATFDRFGAYKLRWSKLMASGSYLGCKCGLKTKTFTMGLFYYGSFI